MKTLKKLIKWFFSMFFPSIVIWRGRDNKKVVALTFDDGPHPQWTPRILETLYKFDVKATFFVVGERARKYPELVRSIADAGHIIGNHTLTHRGLSGISAKVLREEIQGANSAIIECTGRPVRFFRPPRGIMSLRLVLYLYYHRLTCVMWSLDSEDFKLRDADLILQRVRSQLRGDADIILLHDSCAETAAALPAILNEVREKGLSCLTIDRMLAG